MLDTSAVSHNTNMDTLVEVLKSREKEMSAAWLQALGRIAGAPFGGSDSPDLGQEVSSALRALLDILERNDARGAEAFAARLVHLPYMRGAAVNDTVRGYYALFEAVRPLLDQAFAGRSSNEELVRAVERLRAAVAVMSGLVTQEYVKYGLARQDEWDRLAFFGIKGPLARLVSELGALREGAGADLPEEFRALLYSSLSISQRLMSTLENLFMIRRLSEGLVPPRKAPVPVLATLRPIVDEASRRAQADRKVLEWKAPPQNLSVKGDATLLARVFRLALEKALERAPVGARIGVEAVEESGYVRMRVTAPSTEEAAVQPDSGDSVEFAFCRTAVEHMGGRVDIVRQPGMSIDIRMPATGANAPDRDHAGAGAEAREAGQKQEKPAAGETPAGDELEKKIRIIRTIAPGTMEDTKGRIVL